MNDETLAFVKLGGAVTIDSWEVLDFLDWAWENNLVGVKISDRKPSGSMRQFNH